MSYHAGVGTVYYLYLLVPLRPRIQSCYDMNSLFRRPTRWLDRGDAPTENRETICTESFEKIKQTRGRTFFDPRVLRE